MNIHSTELLVHKVWHLIPKILRKDAILAVILFIALPVQVAMAQGSGTVVIDLLDKKTQDPLTCRVQVLNEKGRPVRPRGAAQERAWSLVESPLTVRSRKGIYRYRVFRGPEYAAGGGEFELDTNSEGYDVLSLPRHANMREESWFGGDLATHMSAPKLVEWLPAEGLTMSVQIGQQTSAPKASEQSVISEDGLWVESQSYFDSRPGSGLSLHHWLPPAESAKESAIDEAACPSKEQPTAGRCLAGACGDKSSVGFVMSRSGSHHSASIQSKY